MGVQVDVGSGGERDLQPGAYEGMWGWDGVGSSGPLDYIASSHSENGDHNGDSWRSVSMRRFPSNV